MEERHLEILEKIGLTKPEAKIYFALHGYAGQQPLPRDRDASVLEVLERLRE